MIKYIFIIILNLLTQLLQGAIPNHFKVSFTAIDSNQFSQKIILQRKSDTLQGIEIHRAYNQLLHLKGTISNGGKFKLTQFIIDETNKVDEIGRYEGEINNLETLELTWIERVHYLNKKASKHSFESVYELVDGNQLVKLTLKMDKQYTNLAPLQIVQNIFAAKNDNELYYLLHQTLVDIDKSYMLSYYPFSFSKKNISKNGLKCELITKNLFGSNTEENIIYIEFDNSVYGLFFFNYQNANWDLIGNILISRKNGSNKYCKTNAPGEGYFYFVFEPAVTPDEFLIVGRTYGGKCTRNSVESRSDFYIWEIKPSGVNRLYENLESSFYYKREYRILLEMPVFRSFSIINKDTGTENIQLKITEHIYSNKFNDKLGYNEFYEQGTTEKYIQF